MPEGVVIRRLTAADVDAFVAYWAVSHRFEHDVEAPDDEHDDALDRDMARAFLADPAVLFWLAEHDGRCVGMLHPGCLLRRRRSPSMPRSASPSTTAR